MKRLLIALALLPAALCAMKEPNNQAKPKNKTIQEEREEDRLKCIERWRESVAGPNAAERRRQNEQRQRQMEQEKFRHGMNG